MFYHQTCTCRLPSPHLSFVSRPSSSPTYTRPLSSCFSLSSSLFWSFCCSFRCRHRELYIGNTSPDMTDIVLKDFLSNTMQKVGFAQKEGSPIIHARVSGNFAFVECRSVEETTALLNLNNIPFMGQELKINRPSKYPGPETPHLNWPDVLARYDLWLIFVCFS